METSIIDIKNRNKRRTTRILALIMMIALVFTMTGCVGFYGAGTTIADEAGGDNGNRLCYTKDDGVYSNFPAENTYIKFLHFVQLDSKETKYGIPSNQGMTVIRELAYIVINAVFGKTDITGDKFVSDGASPESIKLNPPEVIIAANNATIGSLGSGYNNIPPAAGLLGALKGLAIAILMAIWAMNFINMVVQERFTPESLLKGFMQLMMGIVVIENAELLVQAFATAGNSLLNSISPDTAINNATQFAGFYTNINWYMQHVIYSLNIGFRIIAWNIAVGTIWIDVAPLIVMLFLAPALVGMLNCAYKIISMMIMCMLELATRVIFAPIPLAFAAGNGFSQESIRYFRGVMACAMQPVFMMLGCAMYSVIIDAVMVLISGAAANTIKSPLASFVMMMGYFILSAYLGTTKQLAQDIVAR